MPSRCAVFTCKNKPLKNNFKSGGISYHVFPRDKNIRKQWIEATGRELNWRPISKHNSICSDHFEKRCYQEFKHSRRLFDWAVPTLKLPSPKEAASEKENIEESTTDDANQEDETPLSELVVPPRAKTPECDHDLVAMDICTKCKKEFEHIEPKINLLGHQVHSIIANVYHFFERELKELKTIYGGTINYSLFQKLRTRTAQATGVCSTMVRRALKEEEESGEKDKKPRRKRRNVVVSSNEEIKDNEKGCDKNSKDNPEKPARKSLESATLHRNMELSEEDFVNLGADSESNIDCQPLVINTDSEYCSLSPMPAMLNQATNTDMTSPFGADEDCSLASDSVDVPSRPPSMRNMDTQTDPQYCSFEPMSPTPSQVSTMDTDTQMSGTQKQYNGSELINPMLSPSICTQMETPPLMATAQLFCSLDPTLNGGTLIGAQNLPRIETQPQLIATAPQYISTMPDAQAVAAFPQQDFNYYFIVDNNNYN